MKKWILRCIAALMLAVVVIGIWKREELVRLNAVLSLFSEEKIVHNFSHMGQIFHARDIPVEGEITPLPNGKKMTLPAQFEDWLAARSATGAVILHNGAIRYEAYFKGTQQSDPRISWSLAKSYLSALFGVIVEQGHIQSLDDPLVNYVPELKGSAYDTVSIRNVLQMESGVTFDEEYLDFWSDINKMGRVLALGGSMDGFAAGLHESEAVPGDAWKYVSIDTHILGMVVRGATGRTIPDLMAEFILNPLGSFAAPQYLTDGYGVAFVLGGLNLTTRDYARMGEMFRNNGLFQGQQIVPAIWATESTSPSAKTQPGKLQYGYQWWMPSDAAPGEFLARGIYSQYVYVNKSAGVVIAINAADRAFRDAGATDNSIAMFRDISTLLSEESP